ncbi:MAG: P-loop NTPase, partial [Planctomycetota bacterium]
VVSIGMMLPSGSDAVIWRGPRKYGAIRQLLKDVTWGELDYLVIDSPPGTGDEPLAVAQIVGSDAWGVVVTTPQDVAISDVRRSVSFCSTLGLQVAGIIENMSGLQCPHCGEIVDLFKTGGGEKLAAEVHVPFLGRIPLDPRIVASGDSGQTFVQAAADSPAAQAGGMGQRAQAMFVQNGVEVILGATGGTPEQIVTDYLADALETGQNACDH